MRRFIPFQKTSARGESLVAQVNHFEPLGCGLQLTVCATAVFHGQANVPLVAVAGAIRNVRGEQIGEFGSAKGTKFSPASAGLEIISSFVLSVKGQRFRIGLAGKSYPRASGWLPKYLVISTETLKSQN